MTAATALSPPCYLLLTSTTTAAEKLINLSSHHQFLHITTTSLGHSSLSHFTSKPTTTAATRNSCLLLCLASTQLGGSVGGDPEDIKREAFFGSVIEEDGESSDEEEEEEEEEEEDEETESSVDLLFRFLQSLFKKVSKRAKKASRSVLPPAISPQTVSFAVDGVLLLASLSIVKALLEVICTLGGTVFVVIMLLRLIWAAISHFQPRGSGLSGGGASFGTTQPVI